MRNLKARIDDLKKQTKIVEKDANLVSDNTDFIADLFVKALAQLRTDPKVKTAEVMNGFYITIMLKEPIESTGHGNVLTKADYTWIKDLTGIPWQLVPLTKRTQPTSMASLLSKLSMSRFRIGYQASLSMSTFRKLLKEHNNANI